MSDIAIKIQADAELDGLRQTIREGEQLKQAMQAAGQATQGLDAQLAKLRADEGSRIQQISTSVLAGRADPRSQAVLAAIAPPKLAGFEASSVANVASELHAGYAANQAARVAQAAGNAQQMQAMAASLRNGLAHYWTMDETSGTRYDIVGTNHMVGSAGSATGLMGACVSQTNNVSGSLTGPTNRIVRGAFSIAFWVYFNQPSAANYYTVISKAVYGSANPGEFRVHRDPSSPTNCFVVLESCTNSTVGKSGALRFETNVWTLFVMSITGTNTSDMCMLASMFGKGLFVTMGANGVTLGGNALPLKTGDQNGVSSTANAKIDEIAIWSRALSPADVHRLYNYGRGSRWPFTVSPPANP